MKCKPVILGFISIFSFPFEIWACPTCSSILERGQDSWKSLKFAEGISWSVAFLLGAILMISILLGVKICHFLRQQTSIPGHSKECEDLSSAGR